MGYKILKTERIFETLKDEWASRRMWWSLFINTKDLGIRYEFPDTYKIIDEKKWALSKIKYGYEYSFH